MDSKKKSSKEVTTPPDFYTNSIASSSRMATISAASAPVNFDTNSRRNTKLSSSGSSGRPSTAGNNLNEMRQQRNYETNSGTATPIPSIANSNNTPTRIRSRRELEHKIKSRQGPRAVPTHSFIKRDTDNKLEQNNNEEEQEQQQGGIPLPKALTDLLLQTAIFGIDTTARLSKPTLQLTKDTLLPQIIIPLIIELFQQYVPTRLQHWIKVLPTSIKNVMSLLWDTDAGQNLGSKSGQLTENIVDMISSDVARQCWIDVTISIIKFMDSLHTPEVKMLLDQFAVGACRAVDVISSGKAKQVWFDVSDSLWALIEVGSDPVMVTSLAEGCAQVCFALENERESLKVRRATAAGSEEEGGVGNEKLQKMMASKRRRERDKRQTGTYPPGKAVLGEGEGRDGFTEALLDGLDGGHRNDEELHNNEDEVEETEGYYYGNIDEGGDDGPPQRVLVPTSSTESISVHNECGINQNEDDESEITTEIEDLGGRETHNQADFDEVDTQSSTSGEKNQNTDRPLAYELLSHSESIQNQMDQQLDWNPNGDDDDGTASQMNDTLPDQPILQFYRRLNEVLVEHRKQSSTYEVRHTRHKEKQQYKEKLEEELEIELIDTALLREDVSPLFSKKIFGLHKRWWKVIIIASLFGIVTMCMLWFALGCYGFYVLVIGGNDSVHVYHPPPSASGLVTQQLPVVIQIVTQASPQEIANQCDDTATDSSQASGSNHNRVSTISLDDWSEMKLGVDRAIEQATTKEQS